MKVFFQKLLSSYVTTIVLLLIYAVALAAATFIEKYAGTATAKAIVYYSPLFFLLQLLLVANFLFIVIRRSYLKSRKWGMLTVHFAFIVILLGAFTSFLFSEEGILHLREGETSNQITVRTSDNETETHLLPFSVELKKFTLTRYPGSSSPSSFESEVIVHVDGTSRTERIFMNNVLDVKGYRFFQASYDKDEQGTVLSVNRDVAGRNITYTGYFLLFAGLILCFVGKQSRFMQLNRRLKELHRAPHAVIGLLFLFAFNTESRADEDASLLMDFVQRHAIAPAHAERFGSLPLQSRSGRVMPVNTFSSQVLRKLHKSEKIGSLNSDQFLVSLLSMPDVWLQIPFISVSNPELTAFYDLPAKQCAYAHVFDGDHYKLQEKLEEVSNTPPAQRTRFDKDLLKLDEQINILHQLVNLRMLNLFPLENAPDHKWYAPGDDLSVFSGKDSLFVSRIMDWYIEEVQEALKSNDWSKADEVVGMIGTYQQAKGRTIDIDPKKIQTELKYNRKNVFRTCKIGYLILGGLLLVFAFTAQFQNSRPIRIVIRLLGILVLVVFHYHIYGMGLRWYIGGYAPWSNSYETMVYVAWATVVAGLLFARRNALALALATLFGGVILFVSGLNWMDPEIGTLVPVLKSPWLMFHVAIIVGAYGFFGISCLMGITNMTMLMLSGKRNGHALFSRVRELSIINEMSLLIGLALMTIGTFLGAIWANESWGRYWGWDPKETWALITMVVYAVVTHLRLIKRCNNLWLFNFTSVIAFSSVLMTFFGVNYLLSGMHSYGQNEQAGSILLYLCIALAVVFILSTFSYISWRKSPERNETGNNRQPSRS